MLFRVKYTHIIQPSRAGRLLSNRTHWLCYHALNWIKVAKTNQWAILIEMAFPDLETLNLEAASQQSWQGEQDLVAAAAAAVVVVVVVVVAVAVVVVVVVVPSSVRSHHLFRVYP